MHIVLLAYYSVAIVVVSVAGGLLPGRVRMTHRWTEMAVSFVAGTMLGIALLHLLPHALAGTDVATMTTRFYWVIFGFLAMFFIERFFCFHHHDVPEEEARDGETRDSESNLPAGAHGCCEHDHPHTDHTPGLSWSGAAMGLTLHSVLAGVALAASVRHAPDSTQIAGLGVFLAILLHKPFDAMTIAMLMARGGWSAFAQCVVNALFALAVPAGMAIFFLGVAPLDHAAAGGSPIGAALAFSAGVFLCVSMSDLLPELHFHHHDRWKLSLALLLGLGVADMARRFEQHTHAPTTQTTTLNEETPLTIKHEPRRNEGTTKNN